MLELRRKIGKYHEMYYLIFILAMTGMTSMGINSDDRIYLMVFAIATVFLLLKMAVTDFTLREFVIMAVFTTLFGVNFLRNGEKTVILTLMGIFGAKNIDLGKVMKYAFWEKAVLTMGTIALAATGVIENKILYLPKNWEYLEISAYGYDHPNAAFANIFVALLLGIIVYGDRLKWYAYVGVTVIMLLAYNVLMCRTGLLVWFVLCIMVLGYRVAKCLKWEKFYMILFPAIPVVLAVLTMVIPLVARINTGFDQFINTLLTGRVELVNQVYDQVWTLVLGHVPRQPFDSMYFHLLYNYGWILYALCFLAYVLGMWYCNEKGQYYGTMALGIMAIYGYMEHMPLSVLWNLPLLYLAGVLFKERKVINEQLQ